MGGLTVLGLRVALVDLWLQILREMEMGWGCSIGYYDI